MLHISPSSENLHSLFHARLNQGHPWEQCSGPVVHDVGPTSVNIYNDMARYQLLFPCPFLTIANRQMGAMNLFIQKIVKEEW
jgi:hypothetical protein